MATECFPPGLRSTSFNPVRVGFDLFESGISVTVGDSQYPVTYPEEIWNAFPSKVEFVAELVTLLTFGIPLAPDAGAPEERDIDYDFARPGFLERYEEWFRLNLPYLMETNASITPDALDGIKRTFRQESQGAQGPAPCRFAFPETNARRAVVALTMGKDSLASLAIGQEMNIDLAGVYCYHPANSDDQGAGTSGRIPQLLALGSQLSIPVHSVSDRVNELTRSLSSANQPNDMMWSMSIAAYSLMLLPFAHYYKARHIVLGNGFEFNYPMRLTRGGAPVQISPLQTWSGQMMLDEWMSALTGGAVRVTSWICSLHAIACHKLVHSVRPDIGLYQMSCRRAVNLRWCEKCATCAENYLFIKAMGRDPASLGFTRAPFDEKDAPNFSIVRNGLDDGDPYRFHAARQELLGFALMGRDAEDSWMSDYVRAKHGDLLGSRIEELKREYLAPMNAPASLSMSVEATAAARRLLL